MTHLLVAGKLHPAGEEMLEQLKVDGVKVTYVEEVSEESYAPYIEDADALVIRTQPLSADTISKAKNLKVVSRHGVGYDSVDLAALNERKIALTIVGDVNSRSVAEHAMTQLLSAAKFAVRADSSVRNIGDWGWRNQLNQAEVFGKNLLIVGYGRIGRHLAKMALGFGMTVSAYDPYLEKLGWPEGDVKPVSDLKEALGWADFISLHVPKGDKPFLGAPEFEWLKPGVVISNTARGGVVCESSLAEALKSGLVRAAGVDVLEAEPPLEASPLFAFENVVFSPHIAGLTNECSERMALASIDNALKFLDQSIAPELVVNTQALS
ncbi:MAG: hydroxyacid dehydrogenase [Pontibacterium sp.]